MDRNWMIVLAVVIALLAIVVLNQYRGSHSTQNASTIITPATPAAPAAGKLPLGKADFIPPTKAM